MTIGEAIREARRRASVGTRELGRQSGISAGQISRIEADIVEQPSVTTIVALSRALGLNPQPLLVAAGHIGLDEGRRLLAQWLRPHAGEAYNPAADSEVVEEWTHNGWLGQLEAARSIVATEIPDPSALRGVAAEVFCTFNAEETEWNEEFLGSLGGDAPAGEIEDLIEAWKRLAPPRRRKVVEYALEQLIVQRSENREETTDGE